MKYFLFLFFIIIACSSKEKKVDLDFFRKEGEKINIFNEGFFAEEKNVTTSIKLSDVVKLNDWTTENYNIESSTDHFQYDGKFKNIIKKNIGSLVNKFNQNGTLLHDGNILYFGDEKGTIYKYDFSNNKIVWEQKIYDRSLNNIPKNISITLYEGKIFASDSLGFIYSLDILNGKVLWKENFGVPFGSNILVYKDAIYVLNQNSRLYSFDTSDGRKIWSFDSLSGVLKQSKSGKISTYTDKLLFSNDVGDLTALDLSKQEVLWTRNLISQNILSFDNVFKISNILINENDVFVSSNKSELLNLNLVTGAIKWSKKIISSNDNVLNSRFLFTLTDNNFLICLNADSGEVIWSTNLSKKIPPIKKGSDIGILSTPKVNNIFGIILGSDHLYVSSTDGQIYKISAINGKFISEKKVNNDLTNKPIIYKDKIAFLNESKELIFID